MPLTPSDRVHCPNCHGTMRSGFVSVSQGLTWMHTEARNPCDFTETLPGTAAVLRANRLPAWRCHACSLVLMRYGRGVKRERDFRDSEAIAQRAAAEDMLDAAEDPQSKNPSSDA